MYCRNCGNKLKDDSNFCGTCGTQVEGNNQAINQANYQHPVDNFQKHPINKVALVISIVVTIVTAAFMITTFVATFYYVLNDPETYDSYHKEKKTLSNHNISINYNGAKWTEGDEENGIKKLFRENEIIGLGYENSDYYYTTKELADSLKKELQNNDATIVDELKEIKINNQKWQRFICEKDDYKYFILVLSDDYDHYMFMYSAKSTIFDYEINNIENIYKTLKLDTEKQKDEEEKAKAKLAGEWDWGTCGYLSFEEDKMFLYKDSSKSMDNVFYGTYTAKDKILTYAADYVDGIYVQMNIDKLYMDGIEQELNNNQLEFAFTLNQDNTYIIDNLSTKNTCKATKIS